MILPKIAIIDPVGIKAGLDHYDVSLAKELNKLSLDVKVYSNFHSKVSIAEHVFSFYIESSFLKIVNTIRSFIISLRMARREKRTVVILHVFHFSFIDFLFIVFNRLFGMKTFLIVHDVENLVENIKSGWLKECINRSDKIIVHNKFILEELKSKVDKNNFSKIHIIPHGNFVDHVLKVERAEFLKKFNLDSSKCYLLFFGMIKKSKGLEDLLNALNEIDESVHLIIAGRVRDVNMDKILLQIKNLNLEPRVHLKIGYISNEDRNVLYNAVDAVVIPYRRIYQSGIMIMAMSYGKVIIASDLPVNKSMLNENAGLLFKVGNSSDLAQKINSLFKGKVNKEQIQKSALKYISENNSWTKIATEFKTILNK
jgi:D-inositol-3-phosphate glycosyltransferase